MKTQISKHDIHYYMLDITHGLLLCGLEITQIESSWYVNGRFILNRRIWYYIPSILVTTNPNLRECIFDEFGTKNA